MSTVPRSSVPARRSAGPAALVLAVLLLSGCTSTPEPSDDPGASPRPSATDAPAPTASPSGIPATATFPADCRTLVSAEVYDAVFGTTPLNHPDVLGPEADSATGLTPDETTEETPAGDAEVEAGLIGEPRLYCAWRDPRADISGLFASIETVDVATADAFFASLPDEGYTCDEVHDGARCFLTRPNEQYPVDESFTHFLRDDVYISVVQANFPTDDLLGEFVATLWD